MSKAEIKVFISYSSKDKAFALKLYEGLKKVGASLWIDEKDIQTGENWDNSIEEALEEWADKLLLLMSKSSVESENVKDEVSLAKDLKKEIIPVLIERCELPMRWKRMQYSDFIETPKKAISKLVEALELEKVDPQDLEGILPLKKPNGKPKPASQSSTIDENEMISDEEFDSITAAINKQATFYWIIVGVMVVVAGIIYYVASSKDFVLATVGFILLLACVYFPWSKIKRLWDRRAALNLLKIQRGRMIRIIHKLSKSDVEKFNSDFERLQSI